MKNLKIAVISDSLFEQCLNVNDKEKPDLFLQKGLFCEIHLHNFNCGSRRIRGNSYDLIILDEITVEQLKINKKELYLVLEKTLSTSNGNFVSINIKD